MIYLYGKKRSRTYSVLTLTPYERFRVNNSASCGAVCAGGVGFRSLCVLHRLFSLYPYRILTYVLRYSFIRRCLPIKNSNAKEHLINEEIDFAPSKIVRVIGEESEQIGLLSLSSALEAAYNRGSDLVLIAPQADPPVCRIMDYGRFRFERDKKEKEARKKQQIADIKEIQLSCHIDTNDFNTKVNHARRFLTDGDKVKVIIKFKGRQVSHLDIGRELLTKFEEACKDLGVVDKKPALEGRSLIMFLAPAKGAAGSQNSSAN